VWWPTLVNLSLRLSSRLDHELFVAQLEDYW
jgi:hypothetical protein